MTSAEESTPLEQLTNRTLVRFSGADAGDLLQRVVTANTETMTGDIVRSSALLSPQGKLLFQFLISLDGEGFLVDIDTQDEASFAKRMSMYRLRADVVIEADASRKVFVSPNQSANSHYHRDERAEGMGYRHYASSVKSSSISDQFYHKRRIEHGVPEIHQDFETSSVFAHEALLDLTGGIDFGKGCYVGQEVVSRVEHRSTARKRFVRVGSSGTDLPDMGTTITQNEKTIGVMGSHQGPNGLAAIRIDKLDNDSRAIVDGIPIAVTSPTFADFDLVGANNG